MTNGADDTSGMGDPADAEDAAWRELVANYGERAVLDDGHPSLGRADRARETPDRAEEAPRAEEAAPDPADVPSYDEERFVPPAPGPVALPRGPRLAAWSGVFVPPAVLLACALLQFRLPSPLGPLLVIWFLTGFGWLVWHMPRGPRAPWDDGAQV